MKVCVVDYGIGNLYSVARALERCGAEVTLSDEPDVIEAAPRLVLPGVGAFADGMRGLRERGLVEPVRQFARSGRPMLGICLGMQMLADASEEFGEHEGLGLIPGRVVAVPRVDVDGVPQKIPHIGWAGMHPWREGAWSHAIMAGVPEGTAMYLVHSYHLVPSSPGHGLSVCLYGGHRITAMVSVGNVIGCQFHPEKSGPAGLALLGRFLESVGSPR